jgi:thymidylate kinase
LVEYTAGYLLLVRPALVASTLVIFDRYSLDALVDPKRYRYSGPQIALRLLWRLSPKPDLIFILDAPPAALTARKMELPIEELHRQREAYRRVAQEFPNTLVVDASAPLDDIASKVVAAIHDFMSSRVVRRFD